MSERVLISPSELSDLMTTERVVLKAIATAPLCTSCHGETIALDVQRALSRRYPRDQATGFKVGDLRGAFSVEWAAGKG